MSSGNGLREIREPASGHSFTSEVLALELRAISFGSGQPGSNAAHVNGCDLTLRLLGYFIIKKTSDLRHDFQRTKIYVPQRNVLSDLKSERAYGCVCDQHHQGEAYCGTLTTAACVLLGS